MSLSVGRRRETGRPMTLRPIASASALRVTMRHRHHEDLPAGAAPANRTHSMSSWLRPTASRQSTPHAKQLRSPPHGKHPKPGESEAVSAPGRPRAPARLDQLERSPTACAKRVSATPTTQWEVPRAPRRPRTTRSRQGRAWRRSLRARAVRGVQRRESRDLHPGDALDPSSIRASRETGAASVRYPSRR